MPVRCLGGVCRGRVRIGRAVAGFALPRKGVTTLRFKAAPGLHAVKIVVRHGRSSSTTLKVTRVRDRITCGYGPLANQLQRVGGARMFYVIRDSLDESGFEDTRTLLVCRDGVALQLVTENGDAESQRFYGEVLTTGGPARCSRAVTATAIVPMLWFTCVSLTVEAAERASTSAAWTELPTPRRRSPSVSTAEWS